MTRSSRWRRALIAAAALLALAWFVSGWWYVGRISVHVSGRWVLAWIGYGMIGLTTSPSQNHQPSLAFVRPERISDRTGPDWRWVPEVEHWGVVTELRVPLWTVFALVTLPIVYQVFRARRHAPGTCPSCGYSLAGLAAGIACPECGASVTTGPAT